jgi:hypothetical protein
MCSVLARAGELSERNHKVEGLTPTFGTPGPVGVILCVPAFNGGISNSNSLPLINRGTTFLPLTSSAVLRS